MPSNSSEKKIQSNVAKQVTPLIVMVVFVLLTIWFILDPVGTGVPSMVVVEVDASQIDSSPIRQMLGDSPTARIGGVDQSCTACHGALLGTTRRNAPLAQHQHVKLNHGINDDCLNCHDAEERDKLALRTGQKISFKMSHQLCAQCHGTTYRDWQDGMHGKTLGSWQLQSRQRRSLKCVECHDPHAPAFDSFEPLPGPHTLRMPPEHQKNQDKIDDGKPATASPSPLRRWSWPTDKEGSGH